MINVSKLKVGDILKVLVANPDYGLKVDDIVRVERTGHSSWDGLDYADVVTRKGYTVEIMRNYADFELLTN